MVEHDDRLSRVFAALADPTRRDMVARLATDDATVSELAAPYDVSLQAVSKHLKVLDDLLTRMGDQSPADQESAPDDERRGAAS
jgi:DNA-binding transcriptional ArsR family regulator